MPAATLNKKITVKGDKTMSTIIMHGNQEESKKVISALKSQFPTVNVKANVISADGHSTIIEAYSEMFSKESYSDTEIDKALLCCSSVEKRCTECPYKKEENCKDRLITDGAVWVQRTLQNACKEK